MGDFVDPVEHVEVDFARGEGFGFAVGVFTKVVEGDSLPISKDFLRGFDGFFESVAGNEP